MCKIDIKDSYLDDLTTIVNKYKECVEKPWRDFTDEHKNEPAWTVIKSQPWLVDYLMYMLGKNVNKLSGIFIGYSFSDFIREFDDPESDSNFYLRYDEYWMFGQ
jgi:hypothetical protein